jgi:hypothetical protein
LYRVLVIYRVERMHHLHVTLDEAVCAKTSHPPSVLNHHSPASLNLTTHRSAKLFVRNMMAN